MSSNRGSRGTFDKNTKKHESQRVAQRSEGDAIDETYGFHPLKEVLLLESSSKIILFQYCGIFFIFCIV